MATVTYGRLEEVLRALGFSLAGVQEGNRVYRHEPTGGAEPGMCLDKGYDYDNTRELVAEFGFTAHVRARGEEAQAIKREAGYRARRWVIERTHSWMNRFRRILVRWEKNPLNYLAMLHFACALITYRCCDLLG